MFPLSNAEPYPLFRIIFFAMVFVGVTELAQAQETSVNFNRDIRPLLSDRCFHCHGPDEEDRQEGLRFDQRDGEEGALNVLVPGDADASELYQRITSDDPDLVMPPPDSHKKPLSEAEKKRFQSWINEGAAYQTFWAFTPLSQPAPPVNQSDSWSTSPIDQFVKRKLDEVGVSPQADADRRTLLRRLSLDLTGLPPSREELTNFLSDQSVNAYENAVDRLLDSTKFGEHMGRHWLDLVRFADTNGIHHDHFRDLSPYRDWVIRSFNENLPYDDFVRYQLAGDLYETPTNDQLTASGFNRLHMIIDRGTMLPEESLARNVIDRVTSVGTAFMGLTVGCAVCHDHKYDPISSKEFINCTPFLITLMRHLKLGDVPVMILNGDCNNPTSNYQVPNNPALGKSCKSKLLYFKSTFGMEGWSRQSFG